LRDTLTHTIPNLRGDTMANDTQTGDYGRGYADGYRAGIGAELWALGAIATIGDAVVCYDRTYGE